MRVVYLIGILVFFLLTVSSASAVTEYILTEDDTNINRDALNNGFAPVLPEGILKIRITYDETSGILTYVDESPHDSNGGTRPYIGDPRIDEVGYNLSIDGDIFDYKNEIPLTGTTWSKDTNGRMDGFGTFDRVYRLNDKEVRPDKVVVRLSTASLPLEIPMNSQYRSVALHLAFDGAYYANGSKIYEINETGVNVGFLGSTYLACGTEIPEFSSVVLPFAAIIGLVLISERRRKE
ncbi:TPA: hypothetical protein HA351_12170 [Methanosarcinaceae archaeon]|nr:hypothetical protein [Methanosarcinaceae archaeon]